MVKAISGHQPRAKQVVVKCGNGQNRQRPDAGGGAQARAAKPRWRIGDTELRIGDRELEKLRKCLQRESANQPIRRETFLVQYPRI